VDEVHAAAVVFGPAEDFKPVFEQVTGFGSMRVEVDVDYPVLRGEPVVCESGVAAQAFDFAPVGVAPHHRYPRFARLLGKLGKAVV
jgi:hypothetical protein